ncbi:MAG: cache domain-containing protein [Desulfobacterales bacterium]|nr:cache domain-containing protein [Desulfobacterales bacterium]
MTQTRPKWLHRIRHLHQTLARLGAAPFKLIRHFRIRYKLLIIYAACFVLTISLAGGSIYFIMKKNVERNIEGQLNNSTSAILNNVKTAVSVSIKNRLRAMAEKNHEIIENLHRQCQAGQLSLDQAQKQAADILLCQSVGTSGYLCILDGEGRVVKHPQKALEGLDISDHQFVREMIARKNGYIEYHWQNPGDAYPRPKALYITYFKPWNWMITVSSYRREFSKLVDINDFKAGILGLKFGKTGYAYVLDTQGRVIIHPELTGINVLTDPRFSNTPFKKMLAMENGRLIYSWKNPGEERARKKLVRFNLIPEYQWIVASSSYLDEFYAPLETIRRVIFWVGLGALVVFVPITFFLSATITQPIRSLTRRFSQDIGKGFSNRSVKMESRDEVGQLTFYYNAFMEKLEARDRSLQAEIRERRQAQSALKESEEKYRSVMEAVPDPIVVYDMEGQVTYLNPAFTRVFGYSLEESMGQKLDHFVPRAHGKETMEGIDYILKGQVLPRLETKRKARDGRLIDVTTRGSVYRDKYGTPIGSVITHRDVSEVKRLEKAIMETGERERQTIGNDLHDDLCPHLIGIEGLTKVLERKMEMAGERADLLDHITQLIREAIAKTRRLARGLSPVYFNHGLESSLRELADTTRFLHGVECRLEVNCVLPGEDQMETIHLYHIAGEAVRNAVRHGGADTIVIEVNKKEQEFGVKIQDNGRGMDMEQPTRGMGLRIMNYRAKIMGGSLGVSSEPGQGTTVQLTLPIE